MIYYSTVIYMFIIYNYLFRAFNWQYFADLWLNFTHDDTVLIEHYWSSARQTAKHSGEF